MAIFYLGALHSPERVELSKLSDLSIDALEDEIGLLSSHLNAATCRLLLLIAELDRREPWATFGCKTCAHYLNWKCGLALSAAREKVRTARALGDLPLISQAFGSGRISYSKARALTRVANQQNEQSLLDIAFAGTATHVERVVRHYRQMQATESPEEIFNRRSFSSYWDDDGSLVFRGRLTAEQGALLMQAIEQARVRPDDHNSLDHYETNGADAVVSICAGYLAGSDQAKDASKGSRTADRFQVKITAPVSSLLPARPAPSRARYAGLLTGEMAAAGFPAAPRPAMSMPITSSTGPMAGQPIWTISSRYAASITPGYMRRTSQLAFQRRPYRTH